MSLSPLSVPNTNVCFRGIALKYNAFCIPTLPFLYRSASRVILLLFRYDRKAGRRIRAPMDIFVLKALVDELRQRLCGAVVSKVFQMSPDDLLLRLWRHQDLRLLLSTQAARPRLHLTTARFRNPSQPLRFAALLRAHLTQVRLCDITVQPYERVVSFCWERPGEAVPTLRLLHTLQGQQANIMLLDTHGTILDALKYVPAQSTSHRAIL